MSDPSRGSIARWLAVTLPSVISSLLKPPHIMRRRTTLARLLMWLAFGLGCRVSHAVDESREPPLQYSIAVGDATTIISECIPVQIKGTFSDPTVTLTPHEYRVFPYRGIRFRYPRSFTFEADLAGPQSKTWVLSGNDFKVMYFVLGAPVSTGQFADSMLDQFGRENARIVDAEAAITLGRERLVGTSLRVSVGGERLVTDIYRIPSRDTEARLLVFQDSLDDAGNRSEEGRRALAEIDSSFTVER